MTNWKEGDPLPPSSIQFIVGNEKRKLCEDEKSRSREVEKVLAKCHWLFEDSYAVRDRYSY